jgi:hypothetical protein
VGKIFAFARSFYILFRLIETLWEANQSKIGRAERGNMKHRLNWTTIFLNEKKKVSNNFYVQIFAILHSAPLSPIQFD